MQRELNILQRANSGADGYRLNFYNDPWILQFQPRAHRRVTDLHQL